MARSVRKVGFHTFCCLSSHVKQAGKRDTSKTIRSRVRSLCYEVKYSFPEEIEYFDFNLDHPCDKVRGKAGSRDFDWGWRYFGDGCRTFFKKDAENIKWFRK